MGMESVALFVLVLPHMLGGMYLGWRLMSAEARDEIRGWFREDGDGGSRLFPRGPAPDRGGAAGRPPLADALPSPVRLREPGRLADRVRAPARRPAHPAEPQRQPDPVRR